MLLSLFGFFSKIPPSNLIFLLNDLSSCVDMDWTANVEVAMIMINKSFIKPETSSWRNLVVIALIVQYGEFSRTSVFSNGC